MHIFFKSALIFGNLFIYNFSLAQDNQVELDPVTVTSSLQSASASKTGRNIVVIKGERFSQLPVHSIDELLRYLPGLEVQARGPMGAQSDFIIRGGTFQQVLVILDGIRLNDPLTGHFSSYIPIAPGEIERIEVLKGASSALYGSEAVGGVIHIITKSFAAKRDITEKNLSAQVTIGEYGLVSGNAGGFYSNGRTAVGGGLLTNIADGQNLRGTKGSFNIHTVSFSVSHYVNDYLQIALRSGYDDRDFSAQNFYTRAVSDTARERVKSFWNTIRTSYHKQKNKLTLDVGYKRAEDNFIFNSVTSANVNNTRLLQALLQFQHQFSEKTTLNTGVQAISRMIISNNRGDHNEEQLAGFVILNQSFGNFYFTPVLRIDWNEQRGAELVPQVNLSYRIHQHQLRASAGKTIRDADFTERYNNYNRNPVPPGQTLGSPDLDAERSFSYEAGYDLFLFKNLKVSQTFFQRQHKKLIDYVPTPYTEIPRKSNLVPGATYALAKNITEVTTTGFEIDLHFVHSFNNNSSIWNTIGLVWLKSKSSEAVPSFYVSSHAKFLLNFNSIISVSRFRFSVNGLYKVREPQVASPIQKEITRDYLVLNGKAEFMILKNKLGIFSQVDNIFDESYSDLLGAQMPGRWLMFGAKLNL